MTFKEFSRELILSGDLDPDYLVMLHIGKTMTFDEIMRWIKLKIFVYDTASELNLMNGVSWDELKFGAERVKSKGRSKEYFDHFDQNFRLSDLPFKYDEAAKYLKMFPGIGSWAAWKFCDLLERVAGIEIDFSDVDFRIAYDYPLKGLCRVNGEPDSFVPNLKDRLTYEAFMHSALLQLGDVKNLEAPGGGRTINIQEVETCLCKYHSHLQGRYTLGKDTVHLARRFKEEGLEFPKGLFLGNPRTLTLGI